MDEKRKEELKDELWMAAKDVVGRTGYHRVHVWNKAQKKLGAVVAEIQEDLEAKT